MAAPTPAKTSPHTVLFNLHHDGKLHRPGATVQLTEKQAATLIAAKVVQAAAGKNDEAAK